MHSAEVVEMTEKRIQTEFLWRYPDWIFDLILRGNTCSHNSSLQVHKTESRLVDTPPNRLVSCGDAINIAVGAEQRCDLKLALFQLVSTMKINVSSNYKLKVNGVVSQSKC